MHQHQDPNIVGRFQAESMRLSAEARLRAQNRGHYRGKSARSTLIKLFVVVAIAVAFFWWVYS
ncbi:MAG: hypothetical protein O3B95_06695 [Chloroflexi bacterium]|nr:hypothetical protein [Chloroflexota bacterium]